MGGEAFEAEGGGGDERKGVAHRSMKADVL